MILLPQKKAPPAKAYNQTAVCTPEVNHGGNEIVPAETPVSGPTFFYRRPLDARRRRWSKCDRHSMAAWSDELRRRGANTPEAAIAASVKAFRHHSPPPRLRTATCAPAHGSGHCRTARRILRTIVHEAGKPIKLAALKWTVPFLFSTSPPKKPTRIYGEYLPSNWQEFTAGRWGIVKRYPLGPIAGITPF